MVDWGLLPRHAIDFNHIIESDLNKLREIEKFFQSYSSAQKTYSNSIKGKVIRPVKPEALVNLIYNVSIE